MRIVDNEAGKLVVLKEGIFAIGTDHNCEWIWSELASPVSLQIQYTQENGEPIYKLRRMGQDKILVNNKALDLCILRLGDIIRIENIESGFSKEVILSDSQKNKDLISVKDDENQKVLELVSLVQSLVGSKDIKKVYPEIVRVVAKLMEADFATLSLLGGNSQLEKEWVWPTKIPNISTSAVKKALSQKKAIQWSVESEKNTVELGRSIEQHQIKSILVAPVLSIEGEMASGYLYLQRNENNKPFSKSERELFDELSILGGNLLTNVQKIQNLEQRVEDLEDVQNSSGMIYQCDSMKKVVALARKASKLPVPVFINGPTGSGKEVMAKYIHESSVRSELPFVAINCGAIPENLIESELFGYVKGAFTGANENRKGLFESAEGGTVFLDELGELPLVVQVKLLRVLQEKVISPVGSHSDIKVDFRLISATHKNLEELVELGSFREDLMFRVNVMKVNLPALCKRERDVLILAEYFLSIFQKEYGFSGYKFSKEAEKAMLRHSWSGNIRELANRIQKALIHTDEKSIKAEDMELSEKTGLRLKASLKEAREIAEREVVDSTLKSSEGNLSLAAGALGVDRKVLRELMVKLHMNKEDYK